MSDTIAVDAQGIDDLVAIDALVQPPASDAEPPQVIAFKRDLVVHHLAYLVEQMDANRRKGDFAAAEYWARKHGAAEDFFRETTLLTWDEFEGIRRDAYAQARGGYKLTLTVYVKAPDFATAQSLVRGKVAEGDWAAIGRGVAATIGQVQGWD